MLRIDLHVHTVNSGHGFNSIHEMAQEAARKKMKIIGITDHGPFKTGAHMHDYFKMGFRIPDHLFGVRILFGAELNITDHGVLDFEESMLKRLRIILAGYHNHKYYQDKGVKKNTKNMVLAIKNPYVNVISHPYLATCPVNILKVVDEACKSGKLLELNVSNFRYTNKITPDSLVRAKKMIARLKEKKQKFIVNSDAHIIHELGDDSPVMARQKELGFTARDVINNYPEELNQHVKIK
jgi:putative hydrolase